VNLFYHSHINPTDQQITFGKEESRHITKVLRYKEGTILNITNGKGYLFTAELMSITPKQCIAIIKEFTLTPELPYQLHMAVAPTKSNDRFEWFLEKATEIGIHKITPIFCDHSERMVIKPERYEKIIESAMKQSLKAYKPILATEVSFSEFMKRSKGIDATKCIAHCQDSVKVSLNSIVQPGKDILMLIGPEGGFSYKEIELALANNFNEISLGGSRLRTETAAIVACTHVSLSNMK
jgi:16S rRNA (uracil1498-N3)-methyltransferase